MQQSKSLRALVKDIPVLGSVARLGHRSWMSLRNQRQTLQLRMKHATAWYFLKNPQSHKLFDKHRPATSPEQRTLIESLIAKGVAAKKFDKAGVEPGEWSRLQEIVSTFARFASERIAAASASYSDDMDLRSLEHNRERFRRFFRDKDQAKLDDYILKMNAENSVLAADHPLITIGLSSAVLDVVSSYMNLWPKLIYADAWYSIPMDPGKRIGSQEWHRDPEDRQMVKVYLYFSNIDVGAGAMEYIVGTSNTVHGQGMKVGEWKPAGANLYPATAIVERSFSVAQHFSCSGPVGTLLFCDTTGLHRGGISTSKPRVVATWTFVTPASRYKRRFTVRPIEGRPLSDEARFAVDL